MKLLVILGSARKTGNGVRVGELVKAVAEADDRFEVDFADLKDVNLPFFNEDFSPAYREMMGKEYVNQAGKDWADRVGEADAVILISPEYNHSYSAILKNAIDWVGKEWANKAVGIVGYSGTPYGGVRAVEHLRQVVAQLNMNHVTVPVLIGPAQELISEDGVAIKAELNKYIQTLLSSTYNLSRQLSEAVLV